MTNSPTIGALAGALAKAQGRIHGAKKDSANPFFKSSYADLASVWDACKIPLAEAEIAVIQYPSSEGALVRVTTMLAHSSGEFVTAEVSATAKDGSPQSVGSTITYLRRYGLASMVGVYADDDDGEAAQGRPHQAAPRQAPRPPPPMKAAPEALAPGIDPRAMNHPADDVGLESATDKVLKDIRKANTRGALLVLVPRIKTLSADDVALVREAYAARQAALP